MLGYAPQAQDAVQDTFLIALRNIERLRKPEAVGGWLCTILRNICLERLRQSRGEILIDEVAGGHLEREPYEPSIDEVIERLALRDWVWTALSELPEPLRITAMLRYFGSYPSYEELSAILGVPLGTVRSRLSRVKVKLADALLKTAGLEHDEARDLAEARARFFAEAVDDINRKRSHEMFTNAFSKDLVMYFPGRSVSHGHTALVTELEGDMEDGIKLHLTNVLASKDITVMEGDFENPPDDPFHCPPATSMVFFHHNGAIRRMRRYFALRTEEGCHNRREEQEVQP
jgi:RNA polymerase sigma-70 factor (ECF subfamily)